MKNLNQNIFILFTILVSGCTQKSDDNIVREYFANGKVEFECPIVNGKQNGTYTLYYDNGQIKAQVTEKDDKMNGYAYHYYSNGILKSIGHYKDGISDGDFVWFDDRRNLTNVTKYVDGEIHSYMKFDSCGNIFEGTPFMTIEIPKDTIKLGDVYKAEIKLNFLTPFWKSNISELIDTTKKGVEKFYKIGDSTALYKFTPKAIGEYKYQVAMWQLNKNEKDSILHSRHKTFTGKYWVVQ